VSVTGWLYGNPRQFFLQLFAAVTVIVWDALVTFLILRGIRLFTPLRMPDAELEVGDQAVHGEEAYPADDAVVLAHGAGPTAVGAPPAPRARPEVRSPASGGVSAPIEER
jgi:ammonium transporter, Amt family